MKYVVLVMLIVLVVLAVGCGTPSPEATLERYFEAFAEKDIATVYSMHCRQDRDGLSMRDIEEVVDEDGESDYDHLIIQKAVITGDTASVELYNIKQANTLYMEMVVEDGEWKVAL